MQELPDVVVSGIPMQHKGDKIRHSDRLQAYG
jgi:hypothetical protein